jgi:hypothetical protein
MEPMRENPGLPAEQQLSRDWARLIRKLRWIGLDSEARRLEQVLSTLPSAKRNAVCDESVRTD